MFSTDTLDPPAAAAAPHNPPGYTPVAKGLPWLLAVVIRGPPVLGRDTPRLPMSPGPFEQPSPPRPLQPMGMSRPTRGKQ